jgi:hypothetical protein
MAQRRKVARDLKIAYMERRYYKSHDRSVPLGANRDQWLAYRHWINQWVEICNRIADR